jgi:hypothetical protein
LNKEKLSVLLLLRHITRAGVPELKKAESIKKASNETKEDEAALRLIRELGLKNNQQISDDDLCTVVKHSTQKSTQTRLEALLNSKYLKAYYILLTCAHELDAIAIVDYYQLGFFNRRSAIFPFTSFHTTSKVYSPQ